jgi:hypothetical protein
VTLEAPGRQHRPNSRLEKRLTLGSRFTPTKGCISDKKSDEQQARQPSECAACSPAIVGRILKHAVPAD